MWILAGILVVVGVVGMCLGLMLVLIATIYGGEHD